MYTLLLFVAGLFLSAIIAPVLPGTIAIATYYELSLPESDMTEMIELDTNLPFLLVPKFTFQSRALESI